MREKDLISNDDRWLVGIVEERAILSFVSLGVVQRYLILQV